MSRPLTLNTERSRIPCCLVGVEQYAGARLDYVLVSTI